MAQQVGGRQQQGNCTKRRPWVSPPLIPSHRPAALALEPNPKRGLVEGVGHGIEEERAVAGVAELRRHQDASRQRRRHRRTDGQHDGRAKAGLPHLVARACCPRRRLARSLTAPRHRVRGSLPPGCGLRVLRSAMEQRGRAGFSKLLGPLNIPWRRTSRALRCRVPTTFPRLSEQAKPLGRPDPTPLLVSDQLLLRGRPG